MIVVNLDDYKLTVTGHAGAGEYGEDVVCAAVSALTYTLARAVLKRCTDPTVKLTAGDALIECGRRDWHKVKEIYAAIADGYELISNSYPDNVQWVRHKKTQSV